TIHSYFKFPPAPYATEQVIPKRVETRSDLGMLSCLIIDEISMVRADLLDLIDHTLRKVKDRNKPFGGVQIVAVGDLFQLPPIVDTAAKEAFDYKNGYRKLWESWRGHFFFDAFCMQEVSISSVEFTKVFRQNTEDHDYIRHLNDLRENRNVEQCLSYFNQRHVMVPKEALWVFPFRKPVEEMNRKELEKIPGDEVVFEARKFGSFNYCRENDLPAPERLCLKPGARVMFLKNHPLLEWVNGTLATIDRIIDGFEVEVTVQSTGKRYCVKYHEWEEFGYNENRILEKIGSYHQLPFALAWAFTIHKIQGMTLEQVAYNPQGTFSSGMAYVALSRTRGINDLYLTVPISPGDVSVDEQVKTFYNLLF
ncbi:MAG: hypothetical protein JXR78_06515, partial [Victivallales bacterium]|nr:hypothetical protein [Victivallales bacterium]